MSLNPYILAPTLMVISAITHALVGVLLKKSEDKFIFRGVLHLIGALILLPFIFVLPVPTVKMWGILVLSALLHLIYQLAQIRAFERSDMSLVYPIMRGTAPALAAIFAFIGLNESLPAMTWGGLLICVGALIGFSWPTGGAKSKYSKEVKSAIYFAFFCGIMIALYTVVDAYGTRLSRTERDTILSYILYFFLFDSLGITAVNIKRKGYQWPRAMRKGLKGGAIGGVLSLISYGSAMVALSLAPIGPLVAIRETSVVFGAIFAVYILKEPFGRNRILLAFALAFGVVLMQINGYDSPKL